MTLRIAVVDPLPMFAHGLMATLRDEGLAAVVPDDLLAWIRAPGTALVLLTVADGHDWARLADVLSARPDTLVIAVLAEIDLSTHVRALSSGAVGVLPRDASPSTVREVVGAAARGNSLIPVEVLRGIMSRVGGAEPVRSLSDAEIGWLRQLADGVTVGRLAQQVGYSERMMFRLLADVYTRLGAGNRTKAIMRARDEGWL